MNKETEILLKCQRVVESCEPHQKEMAQGYLDKAYDYLYNMMKPRLIWMGLPDPYKATFYYNYFSKLKERLKNVQNPNKTA